MCLTANPGVGSSSLAQSNTFVELDHEIISSHSPPLYRIKKGCCQLQVKVCPRSTGNCLVKLTQEKVWLGELTVLP